MHVFRGIRYSRVSLWLFQKPAIPFMVLVLYLGSDPMMYKCERGDKDRQEIGKRYVIELVVIVGNEDYVILEIH